MRFANHFRMARLICQKMKENDMPLNRLMFIYGNLAPDMTFSYLFRKHSRAVSDAHLGKQIQLLYEGGITPGHPKFSYHLGVMSHYVCDFLCYPHTPAFYGGMREHIAHENRQSVAACDILPFDKRKSRGLNLIKLTDALNKYITRRERLFALNTGKEYTDIPVAMHVATWAAAGAYLYVESNLTAFDNTVPTVTTVPSARGFRQAGAVSL